MKKHLLYLTSILLLPSCKKVVSCNMDKMNFNVDDKTVDVIVLAGQSNCEGFTNNSYLFEKSNVEENNLYQNGFKNCYINYTGSSSKTDGFKNVKAGQGLDMNHFGIELGMAKKLEQLGKTKNVYLIKYAIGGTTLYDKWYSPTYKNNGGLLYNNLIDFVDKSIKLLKEQDLNPVIKSFCWMQGESDATSNSKYKSYYKLEKDLFFDLNNKFKIYTDQNSIQFISAGIYDTPLCIRYKEINDAKVKVSSLNCNYHYLNTLAEKLDYRLEPIDNPDLLHYDALSEIRLGEMFIEKLDKLNWLY